MAGSIPPEPVRVGRYQVLRWLRDTALAHVYQCDAMDETADLGDVVELHVLSAQHHQTPDRVAAFLEGSRVGTWLSHRGLPQVLEVSAAGEVPYAVHAWVAGPTLHQLLTEKGWGRSLDLRMVVRLGLDVAEALAHAYDATDGHGEALQVVHGGISPDRILVTPDGYARVMDFGTPASPRYHAPEILAGGPPSASADVYALGVVLYALVTGQHAWPGTDANPRRRSDRLRSPRSIRADVPVDLDSLVLRCLEDDPERRPPDMTALADALSHWLLVHGGPVADAALAAWGAEEVLSDGSRLVGDSHFEGPTQPNEEVLAELPTVPDLGAGRRRPLPMAPPPGSVQAMAPPAPPDLPPDDRWRPVVAIVLFALVAGLGGTAIAWIGPAFGLPAIELGIQLAP